MARGHDVVVIGGGVMGLCAARELRRLGAGRVALLERRFLGAGESGKSGAILRQHYSHAETIRMARASLQEFAGFRERTGHDIGFERPGMLFLAPVREREALEANVRLQQAEGVQVSVLDAEALRELEPRGRYDDVVAAWEPEAAFVDPMRTLAAFGAEAARAGVTLLLGCEARRILVEDEGGARRVRGVDTDQGRLEAAVVVAAAGPWSSRLLEPLSGTLPLEVVRPQQAFLRPPGDFGPPHPIVADLAHEVYYKPEGATTRVGSISYDADERIADPDRYDESVSDAFLREARSRVARRLPAYEKAVLWGGGSGLYTVTPDAHAAIGPLAGVEGVVVVTGFSGHGFKLSPVVGRGVAESVVHGRATSFDMGFFDPGRFERASGIGTSYRYKILG
jgi:sarcosine oxidase subunit beta